MSATCPALRAGGLFTTAPMLDRSGGRLDLRSPAWPEEVDHDSDDQRHDRDASDDEKPRAVGDQSRVPRPGQSDPDSGRARDRTEYRGCHEHLVWHELLALELGWKLVADDQDVDEEDDHRQAPDHGH